LLNGQANAGIVKATGAAVTIVIGQVDIRRVQLNTWSVVRYI